LKIDERNPGTGPDITNSNIILQNGNSTQFYNLQLSKCKFEYFYDIEKFWSKYKITNYYKTNVNKGNQPINSNFNNKEDNISLNFSLDIIQEFSFFLRLEIGADTKCNFDITQINININHYLTNKLNALSDIFKIDTKSDIFESKFKNRNEIAKNSTKRGRIELILDKTDNISKKYLSALAGGYIYLFENAENEFPDISIPLKNLAVEKIVSENSFRLRLNNLKNKKDETKFDYLFAFDTLNALETWIVAINDRKTLMSDFSKKLSFIGNLIVN